MANFCRSPVAEKLMAFKFDRLSYSSAGLSPILSNKMDERSRDYLINVGINDLTHIPKQITYVQMNRSQTVFAMDPYVLLNLNNLYPKFKSKIKLFNYCNPKISIKDPFKYDEAHYEKVMKNINKICDELVAIL